MNEHYIGSYVHQGKIGVLIELATYTQMVHKEPEFLKLIHDLAMHIAAENPSSIQELENQQHIKFQGQSIGEWLTEGARKLNEGFKITRFVRWDQEQSHPLHEPEPPHDPAIAMNLKRA